MKKRTYISASLILTALVGAAAFWNFGAQTASAQKSDDNLGIAVAFDARNEFSNTQNPNGVWTYGYSNSDADNTLNLFAFPADSTTNPGCSGGVFEAWRINNGDQIPHIARHSTPILCNNVPGNALFMHPGFNNQRAVVRWTAPSSGTFQVTGSFQKHDPAATSDLKIIKNAATPGESVVFTGAIGGAAIQQAFNFTVSVAAGDKLDFSVGDADNGQFNDGSTIVINIGQPVTACLIAPANLQVDIPGENSPTDIQSVNPSATLAGDAGYETGKVGRGFKFDGAGDYVKIDDNAAQKPANQITVEGWFIFNNLNNFPHLVSKPLRNSAFNSYALWYDGSVRAGYYDSNGGWFTYASGFQPQPGVWNHYAMVINTDDAGADANTVKLYINGVETVSGAAGAPIYYNGINDALAPHPLLVGADYENNAPSYFLNGSADEVSIYGRALSPSEIFNIYRQGSFGKCAPTACVQPPVGLTNWYPAEDNGIDIRGLENASVVGSYAAGKIGRAFNFNGDTGYAQASTDKTFSTFTVEQWIYPRSYNANPPNNFNASTFELGNNTFNRIGYSVGGGVYFNQAFILGQNVLPPLNQWSHIAVVVDQTSATQTLKIYLNGVPNGSTTIANAPMPTGIISIGRSFTTQLNNFDGLIDETGIFSRALSQAELQSIASAGSSGKCKPSPVRAPSGMRGFWTGDGETTDFLGLNPAGVLQGNTNYKVGRVGQSFNFDGNGDYVEIPDDADQRPATGAVSVEGWFKFNSLTNQALPHMVSKPLRNSHLNSYALYIEGSRLKGGHGTPTQFDELATGFVPNLGEWYHFAYTVDDANNVHTVYVNGVPILSQTTTLPLYYDSVDNALAPHPLLIGGEFENNNPQWSMFGQADEVSIYDRALPPAEILAVYRAGLAGKLKEKTVSVLPPISAKTKGVKGSLLAQALLAPATVQLSAATVSFANLTSGGTVSESGIDLANLPPLPSSVNFTGLAYDISTTAAYQNGAADDVQVCFNVPALLAFSNLRVLHLENGAWVDRTAGGNTSPNLCTDNLTSLSPFVIVQALAPTAANVSVAGKVSDSSGAGLGGVSVTLTDSQGRSVYAKTNNFGRYSFADVSAGDVYIVSVSSKRYTFTVSTRAVNVQDAVENVDFTADSEVLRQTLAPRLKN